MGKHLHDHFDVHNRPFRPAIENYPTRHRLKKSVENLAAVIESVAARPNMSVRHCCQEINLHRNTVQRILTKHFDLRGYKIELIQQLQHNDEFYNKIIFSDEFHFHLNRFR